MENQQNLFPSLDDLHLLKHPFYQDWMAGKLSMETLRDYACQYHFHVDAFPRYLSAAHSINENADQRRMLLENLADEEGLAYGVSHPELWRRFAEGMGATRAEVEGAEPRAAISNVVNTFFRLSRSSAAEGLGALYAYESQVPEIAQSKIEGLKERYGVTDERTLAFFEVHKTADVAHREVVREAIAALPADERRLAERAAEQAAKALWGFLTDVHAQGGYAAA